MLYAINYCHNQKICHRDLKPQNFMLLNKQSLSLKLIDFGLSYQWQNNMKKQLIQKKINKIVGTAYYVAPQVIKKQYDQRCDLWSLGIILYIIVSARPPFYGNSQKQIFQSIKKGSYTLQLPQFKHISAQLKDLIRKLLKTQDKRISIEQIYKHPWIKKQKSSVSSKIRLNFNKLKRFSNFSKMKTFAVAFIASQLPADDIQQMSKLFKQIDKNNDGFLSAQQIKQALQKQRDFKQIQQLQNLINFIDTDNNGKINYTQFIACYLQSSTIYKQQNLRYIFQSIDIDGNGKISKDELKHALKNDNRGLSNSVIQQILTVCDRNKDGQIDFKQFLISIAQINS